MESRSRCSPAAGVAMCGCKPRCWCSNRGRAAQAYPTRRCGSSSPPARWGQGDTTARLVAAKLTESLGQSFYIENMPGRRQHRHGGHRARCADGYTLLAATSNIVTNISLYPKVSYDPYKDFAPISLMCSSPHVLVVHPIDPAQTVNELVALAKASPANTATPRRAAARPRISPASCSS